MANWREEPPAYAPYRTKPFAEFIGSAVSSKYSGEVLTKLQYRHNAVMSGFDLVRNMEDSTILKEREERMAHGTTGYRWFPRYTED